MPKRYARKKVGRARRYRKAPSTKSVARIAKRVVMRNIETKESRWAPGNVGGSNFTSVSYGSGAVVAGLVGSLSRGTAQNNYIGNAVYVRGVRLYLAIQPGDNFNNIRFLVVGSPKGTVQQPSLTANFVQALLSGAASGTLQWAAPVDTSRYKVYLDRTFNVKFTPVDGSTAASVPQTKFLKTFVKINRKFFFDDGQNINNDVYLVAISDSAALPHPGLVTGFINLYFKDA